MKIKGQFDPDCSLDRLAPNAFGGLAEWLIALVSKTSNRAGTTVRRSESYTRRQIETSPMEAGTSTREKKRTAEAARIRKFSIRLMAVKFNRRFHSDLPQLPDRLPEIR